MLILGWREEIRDEAKCVGIHLKRTTGQLALVQRDQCALPVAWSDHKQQSMRCKNYGTRRVVTNDPPYRRHSGARFQPGEPWPVDVFRKSQPASQTWTQPVIVKDVLLASDIFRSVMGTFHVLATRLLSIWLCIGPGGAHVALTYPPARKFALDFLDNARTIGPCGMPKSECVF